MWDESHQKHDDYLMSRRDEIEDLGERAEEIIAQYACRADPDSCTDDDLQRAYGKNWQAVTTVIKQAAALTRDQAERMAVPIPMPEHELDWYIKKVQEATGRDLDTDPLWDFIGDAGDEATEPMWSKGDTYWQNRMAYLAALLEAMLGDELPESLRLQMTYYWKQAF
jgi:hypothetical protein